MENEIKRGMDENMKDWYELMIEEPIRNLVRILRNNGFNTVCSCGHLPKPYIQIEWYDEKEDIRRLYDLLREHNFKNFTIMAYWNCRPNTVNKIIELAFYCGVPWGEGKEISSGKLAKESDIRDIEE